MIFITVGSRSFQFDRFISAVDKAVEEGKINDEIFAQVGSSTYAVKNFKTVDFLNHDEFNNKLNECNMVLTHGGTGVIVNSLKLGKRVVAVPRLAQYNEVVDDHQIQLVKAFEKLGMVTGCYVCDKITEAIQVAKEKEVVPYKSNTENVINSLDAFIQGKPSKEKIRILMCSSDRKEKGGMNSVIDQLMEHDWGEKFQLSYLATHISGNLIKKTSFFFGAYLKLKRLLKKDAFGIIHIHMSYKGSFYRKYYVTKLCKKYNKKVIIHLHGSEFKDFYNKGDGKRKAQIKELFSIADVTIVLGKDWENFIKSIAPKANTKVVNNAIAIPEINEKDIRGTKVLLFLGALIQRKGVIDLLHAVKNLSDRGINNYHLLIAGSGEEETSLKKYVEENKLKDNVEFLGWITKEQKPALLVKSDILVLPSFNEGLPIAILEAMSYGLSIISTNVGSIAEAVNGNGFLINPGDVEALTQSIKILLCDDETFKQQSKKSRMIAEEKFSEDVFFDQIKEIYLMLGEKENNKEIED